MAVDMFLKLKGIDGESKDKKHGKEIDILSWSFGMSNAGYGHVGGGSGAGKVNVNDISVIKYVDKSSPNLMQYCCKGSHIDEGLITVRKAGGEPVEYVKIKLTEVLITSVQCSAHNTEDRLTESVTLNFSKFEYVYTEQDEKGKAAGSIPITWDIAANVP